MYFLVKIEYTKTGLAGWLYNSNKCTITKVPLPENHLPYLLTNDVSEIINNDKIVKIVNIVKYDPTTFQNRKMYKVYVKNPIDIYNRRKNTGLRTKLKMHWESNIPYLDCYVWDKGYVYGASFSVEDNALTPTYDLKRYVSGDIKQFLKESFTTILNLPSFNPKRVALDIETKMGYDAVLAAEPITACGLVDNRGKKILLGLRENMSKHDQKLLSKGNTFKASFTDSKGNRFNYTLIMYNYERQLIQAIFNVINTYPFVITFNGDGYDMLYIYNRAKRLGFTKEQIPIIVDFSGYRTTCYLKNSIHIDLMRFFGTGITGYVYKSIPRQMSLNEISKLVTGKVKLKSPNFSRFSLELAGYCVNDALLELELTTVDDNLLMTLIILLARLYNISFEDLSRTRLVRLNIKLFQYAHRKLNYLIPRVEYFKEKNQLIKVPRGKGKKYKGAIVYYTKPGIYFGEDVYDFTSLYPGVTDTRNLSYETLNCKHPECFSNKVPDHTFHVCIKVRGIVGALVGALRDVRIIYKVRAKDKGLNSKQLTLNKAIVGALKIAVLTHYGIYAEENNDLYLLPLASAITAYGRHSLISAIKTAIDLGFDVHYGDTDSIFIKAPTEHEQEKLITAIIKKIGVEIALDKSFRYVVLSKRKHYLGVFPDGTVDVKGLMGKKRHICKFLRDIFTNVCEELGKVKVKEDFPEAKKSIVKMTKKIVKLLKERKVSLKDLAYHVQLGRSVDTGKGQNYDVAKQYNYHGQPKKRGDIIKKVLTVGPHTAKPLEFTRLSEVNIKTYINVRLRGILEQLFVPLDIDFQKIIKGDVVPIDVFQEITFGEKGKKTDEIFIEEPKGMEKWMRKEQ